VVKVGLDSGYALSLNKNLKCSISSSGSRHRIVLVLVVKKSVFVLQCVVFYLLSYFW